MFAKIHHKIYLQPLGRPAGSNVSIISNLFAEQWPGGKTSSLTLPDCCEGSVVFITNCLQLSDMLSFIFRSQHEVCGCMLTFVHQYKSMLVCVSKPTNMNNTFSTYCVLTCAQTGFPHSSDPSVGDAISENCALGLGSFVPVT